MEEDFTLVNSSADWGVVGSGSGSGELSASPTEEHHRYSPAGAVAAAAATRSVRRKPRNQPRRTKNFSAREDEMIARAWLNVSMDPVEGSERASYWKRIHDYYQSNRDFKSDRNQCSVTHRWSTIQDSVCRFERCLGRVKGGAGQEGVITQDVVCFCVLAIRSPLPES
jgi:hypothetical protein